MTWTTLDKADGPKCPHCGCCDTEILPGTANGSWFGGAVLSRPPVPIPPEQATRGTALCGHCNRRFAVRMVDVPVGPEAADVLYGAEEPVVGQVSDDVLEDLASAKKVPMVRLRCPACQSTKIPIQSTKKPAPPSTRTWRNHLCRDCGHTFQSFEETIV